MESPITLNVPASCAKYDLLPGTVLSLIPNFCCKSAGTNADELSSVAPSPPLDDAVVRSPGKSINTWSGVVTFPLFCNSSILLFITVCRLFGPVCNISFTVPPLIDILVRIEENFVS